ncbi:Hormone-sensitive lipase [Trichoplax sp. H2]|nr:Hormone-sensitive lipase [Trichoplax sp. H2]|eukprot:RDD46012.1 Hormone-sensitive lipase [Trichoplax sp. H2]
MQNERELKAMEDRNGFSWQRGEMKRQESSTDDVFLIEKQTTTTAAGSNGHFNKRCHDSCTINQTYFQRCMDRLKATANGNHYSPLLQLLTQIDNLTDQIENHFISLDKLSDSEKSLIGYVQCIKIDMIHLVDHHLWYILDRIHTYDCWQDGTKGNGYRSVLTVMQSCLVKMKTVLASVQVNMKKLLFRLAKYLTELEDFTRVFSHLASMLQAMKQLMMLTSDGRLFHEFNNTSHDFLQQVDNLDQECFYGRVFAFQYPDSIANSLKVINLMMAAYGEAFARHNNIAVRAAGLVLYSAKYYSNPQLKARQIVDLSKNQQIEFTKSFWQLNENQLLRHVPSLLCNSVAVNQTIQVKMETINIHNTDNKLMVIPFPGNNPDAVINMRLLSYYARKGQEVNKLVTFMTTLQFREMPYSKGIVIHFHGGGFIAQSSRSHEIYLRSWVRNLDVPVVSIDYTLSPEASFPYAIEECFYAYCWILQHISLMGSTAEYVCLTGDSAGATLAVCVAMRAAEYGLRIPDGIVCSYPAFMFRSAASPSRCLSYFDPLLQQGFLTTCLSAYLGVTVDNAHVNKSSTTSNGIDKVDNDNIVNGDIVDENNNIQCTKDVPKNESSSPRPILSLTDHVLDNPYLSPLLADDNLLSKIPPMRINACDLDPILDDSIAFARRLKRVGVDVQVRVFSELPHGFLNFVYISEEATAASDEIVSQMKSFLSDSTSS